MQSITDIVPLFILLVCTLVTAQLIARIRQRLPLPPGPKRLPIVGNLLDGVPQVRPWVKYHELAQEFETDVVFLQYPFQPVVVVDSVEAAVNLMEKRARRYSDKPISVMDELTGWDWNLAVQRYGPQWRRTRRYFHQYFYPGAIKHYRPFETQEVHAFLRRALNSPGGINIRSVNQIFSSLILDMVYGMRVNSMDDEFILRFEEGAECFGKIKIPGAFWIDSFPLLRYVPTWFPGAYARKYGARYRPLVVSLRDMPYDAVKSDMAAGRDKERVAHKMTKRVDRYAGTPLHAEHEIYARNAAGIAYIAGVETSLNSTAWFLLAMAMYPEVQRKAQAELDALVGTRRLPDHDDMVDLPYCHAILLEVLRWKPAVPLGIPHRSMEEDEYNGYRIPEGTMIIPNAWAMLRDPADYPDPDTFKPERFLSSKDGKINPDVRDPATIMFGFGRRICPGRYFAKETLFLTFASILTVYDLQPIQDENGQPVKLHAEAPGSGILYYPDNLHHCAMKPRSAAAEKLIRGTDYDVE